MIKKLSQLIQEELQGIHFRLLIAQLFMGPLPAYTGGRIRPLLLRLAGLKIGKGTIMSGSLAITGTDMLLKHLSIGRYCYFNVGCFLDVRERIEIGDYVHLGHQVMLLTTSHVMGEQNHRAGPLAVAPIYIETGAWLGARVTVLPGVNIGSGTVVGAGAVVTRNLPANTVCAGVPARVIRELEA